LLFARTGESAADPEQARRLSELREIALLLTADIVDRQLEDFLVSHGIDQPWGAQERILVCITPRANAARMIASGKRSAERFHCDLFVAYVEQPDLKPQDQAILESSLALARQAPGARPPGKAAQDGKQSDAKAPKLRRLTSLEEKVCVNDSGQIREMELAPRMQQRNVLALFNGAETQAK